MLDDTNWQVTETDIESNATRSCSSFPGARNAGLLDEKLNHVIWSRGLALSLYHGRPAPCVRRVEYDDDDDTRAFCSLIEFEQ